MMTKINRNVWNFQVFAFYPFFFIYANYFIPELNIFYTYDIFMRATLNKLILSKLVAYHFSSMCQNNKYNEEKIEKEK